MAIIDDGFRDVKELTQSIEQLRHRYERYFAGLDKIEPGVERKRIQKLLDQLSRAPITNTQVKFQLNQAKGKFNTLQSHWNRVLLQMERGTYVRDRFRTQLHEAERGTGDVAPASKSEPRRASGGDDTVDKLHRAYLYAKRKCQEPTEGISKERFARSLEKQVEKLKAKNPGSNPEFKVVIKDGKARVVARRQTTS